jgi:hypothetical protein
MVVVLWVAGAGANVMGFFTSLFLADNMTQVLFTRQPGVAINGTAFSLLAVGFPGRPVPGLAGTVV